LGGSVSASPGAAPSSGASSAPRASPLSGRIREQRCQPLRGSANQREIKRGFRALETEQGKVRLPMIKQRLKEMNKYADDEERRMDLRRRRKVLQDLISSNARETDEDFGKRDHHVKELSEIDRELEAANKIDLQPDFPGLASPETPDKVSEE
jgi:hypothetical protein